GLFCNPENMSFLTQQFIAAWKKLREHLRIIREHLTTISAQLESQTHAIRDASDAQAQSSQAPPVLRAELHIPPAIYAQKKSENKRDNFREWLKVGIEFATLVALIFYAHSTYKQWDKM